VVHFIGNPLCNLREAIQIRWPVQYPHRNVLHELGARGEVPTSKRRFIDGIDEITVVQMWGQFEESLPPSDGLGLEVIPYSQDIEGPQRQ
jgi:hypothetical protein